MYFKVKITKRLPQAKTGGFTGNNLNKQVISFGGADMNAASRHLENSRYLKQVPRDEANLEAEKGESAFGDINGDGFTEHMLIGGKRHHSGGTPLNLPDGTFIFSDTASMKITDCNILKMFSKACGKKGYTPAELAKPYDVNKYRTILEDPNSDKVDKKTAELMIKNINLKLGALALAQEAKKGFPQGIPEVAKPYMEAMKISEEDLIPQKAESEAQMNDQAMQNPYENQGMGEQSPEEEMMEQGPGMQNPQEESMEMPPMAQYGRTMGGFNPYEQFNPNQQLNSENDSDNSQSTGKGGFFSNLFGGNNKRRIKNKKNTTIINNYGAPQQPATGGNNYNYYGASSTQGQSNPYASQPASRNDQQSTGENNFVNESLKTNQTPTGTPSFTGASPRFSQGTFGANGYTPPAGYRDGGSLNRFEGGGVNYNIPKDAIIIDREVYDNEEDYTKARNEQFAKAGKKPVYIKMPDGKYKQLTQKTKTADPYTGEDLGTTWNNSEKVASQFRDMNKSINTPEFTKVLAQYTRAALKNEAKYKGKSGKTSKAYAELSKKEFKDEEIRDAFAKHQKRNLALQANGIKARYFQDEPTGKLLTPEQMVAKKVLNDDGVPIKLDEAKQIHDDYQSKDITDLGAAFEKIGIPLEDTALEQATFQGFTDALKNKEKLTGAEKDALNNWEGFESGVSDETGQENNKISPIDRVYTNTTGEQLSKYSTPAENEFVETDVEGTPIEQTLPEEEEVPEDQYQGDSEWWLQDKLNAGLAAGDYLNEQKTLPWSPSYEPQYMAPTFYNPDAELNAQSADINAMSNAMAQFLGPQQTSVRQSALFGQGAKSAAETLARYNNLNVGVADQFNRENTNIANDAQRFNQARNVDMYDKNTLVNQNYRSNKSKKLHNLLDATNAGITNANKTDAMNQMYPQYAVDPSVGGKMHFTRGKKHKPTDTMTADEYAMQLRDSNLDEESRKLLLKDYIKTHGSGSSSDEVNPDMLTALYGKKGGSVDMAYVMGSNVFPFMFT